MTDRIEIIAVQPSSGWRFHILCDVNPAGSHSLSLLFIGKDRVFCGAFAFRHCKLGREKALLIVGALPSFYEGFPMFGSFFNTVDVDQYADWIVTEVKRTLPPSGTKNVEDRAEKLNASIARKTGEFARSTKLNIYKKARLAARVREGMHALGYSESFVKSFSLDLLTRLQVASKQRGP